MPTLTSTQLYWLDRCATRVAIRVINSRPHVEYGDRLARWFDIPVVTIFNRTREIADRLRECGETVREAA